MTNTIFRTWRPLLTACLTACLTLAVLALILPAAATAILAWLPALAPVLLLGTAVTANQIIKRSDPARGTYLVAASARIYEGTFCFEEGGYAEVDSNSGANPFLGVAVAESDNSSGSAGDTSVEIYKDGVFEFVWNSDDAAQGDVGDIAYAIDNTTVDDAVGATGVYCGHIEAIVDASTVLVRIDTLRHHVNPPA